MTRDCSSSPSSTWPRYTKHLYDDSDDDGSGAPKRPPVMGEWWNVTTAILPRSATAVFLRRALGVTVALYVLNQAHLLPKPISAIVSRTLFWPTLPITVARRIGQWSSVIDDTVVMGGAPFGFCRIPDKLYNEYGVRGVVNLCQEYRGPVRQYARLGIQQLWLPTVDHFVPSADDLESAVSFIEKHRAAGDRVYVHCRAGHGRSASAVLAWILFKNPDTEPVEANRYLGMLRKVRSTLWKQPSVREFHSRIQLRRRQASTADAMNSCDGSDAEEW